jgi:hypothetical protein
MKSIILLLLFVIVFVHSVVARLNPQSAKFKNFGIAIKWGDIYNEEKTIFEYKLNPTVAYSAVITQMWCTALFDGNERSRFKIYVDNESVPSIDYEWLLGLGVGQSDLDAPWGTVKAGYTRAYWNSYKIPFYKSIRITAQLASDVKGPEKFYFYVRGIENYPVIIGDIELPVSIMLFNVTYLQLLDWF